MKPSHFKTPRTQDECVYTHPDPIEHYRAPGYGAIRCLIVVVAVCVVASVVIVATGVPYATP